MTRSLVAIPIVLAGSIAAAQPPVNKPLGKKQFAEGKITYAAGDYLGAAQHFEAAYKADPDPAYIFNVGQAYRRRAEAKSGTVDRDCQRSLFAYKKFLDQVVDAPNKAEVETYVKEMTECAGKLAQEPSPWDAPVKPPPDPGNTGSTGNGNGNLVVPPPIEESDQPGLSGKQKIGVGVGAAGVVTGVVALLLVKKTTDINNEKNAFESRNPLGSRTKEADETIRQFNRDGSAANSQAWATGIVGGVLVLGGGALFLFGGSSTKEHKITVAPSPRGAMVFGSFRF